MNEKKVKSQQLVEITEQKYLWADPTPPRLTIWYHGRFSEQLFFGFIVPTQNRIPNEINSRMREHSALGFWKYARCDQEFFYNLHEIVIIVKNLRKSTTMQ